MGQASAALGAATGQDLAAVGSSHSLAEAVLHLAMTLLGLVSSFHCVNLLLIIDFLKLKRDTLLK